MTRDSYNQQFSVPYQYPVHFCSDIFNESNTLLADVVSQSDENRIHSVAVYIDSGVADKHPELAENIENYFKRSSSIKLAGAPEILSGSEKAKSGWDDVRGIMSSLGNKHMCRQSYVMAIGGGSILDMVGFAASLVHRGLRLIRIPTTVLAQNDAGVGVKNGMNEHNAKNYIGTFAPPFAVINDSTFLSTLSDQDWTGGIAEAFKVAIIKDADFFAFLVDNAEKLVSRDINTMDELIYRCAIIHLEHIKTQGDPFEFGSSRPLDFGHWSAHKLEVLSKYKLGHGQAVSVGIALDSYYAMRTGHISEDELNSILNGLQTCHLPVWNDLLQATDSDDKSEILGGLEQFREHLGGELTIALPDSIGRICEVNEVNPKIVAEGIYFLKEYEDRT